jgi:hypothetical protein
VKKVYGYTTMLSAVTEHSKPSGQHYAITNAALFQSCRELQHDQCRFTNARVGPLLSCSYLDLMVTSLQELHTYERSITAIYQFRDRRFMHAMPQAVQFHTCVDSCSTQGLFRFV